MSNEYTLDELISMLESATEETDKNDTIDIDEIVSDEFDSVKRFIFDDLVDKSSKINKIRLLEKIVKLKKLIKDSGNASPPPITSYIYAFETLQNPNLSSGTIYNYVLNKTITHSEKWHNDFVPSDIVGEAIAKYFCLLTKLKIIDKKLFYYNDYDKKLSEDKFEWWYDKFLKDEKECKCPNVSVLEQNITFTCTIHTYIYKTLIHEIVAKFSSYKNQCINELTKIQNKNKNITRSKISSYAKAIASSLESQLDIYDRIGDCYLNVAIDIESILDDLIDFYMEMNQDDENVSICHLIDDTVKPLRDLSRSMKNVLNENSTMDISSQLKCFIDNFNSKIENSKNERLETLQEYKKDMGFVLMKLSSIDTSIDYKCLSIENINKEINIENFINKFNSNIDFLNNILEHSNECSKDIKSILFELLPNELHGSLPESNNNLISSTISNITKLMCGEKKEIEPDINIVSNNIILIPDLLTSINTHIDFMVKIVNEFSNKDFLNNNINISFKAINTVANVFFAYLAILLNIYSNLTIIEKSSLTCILAICKRCD